MKETCTNRKKKNFYSHILQTGNNAKQRPDRGRGGDRALEKVFPFSMGRIDRSRRYATKIRQWVLELPRNATVKPSNELLRGQPSSRTVISTLVPLRPIAAPLSIHLSLSLFLSLSLSLSRSRLTSRIIQPCECTGRNLALG